MNYIDIIEKNIYNIDSKICGIIDDYTVLQNPQKVADYIIQFLRTYLEHIAARIYACENPDKKVPIRGKDKWYTQYMKPLKENNEYGYIWDLHRSLQITTSHYVPAEDGAIRLMYGYLPQLYQLDNINGDNPVVPTFQMLNIYGERDLELKVKVIKAVSDSPRFSIIFLGDEFKDDVYEVVLHEFADGDVEVILNIFRDDIKALSNIYMNILKEGRRFDLGGKLFKRIFEHRELMWNDYVEYIEENSYRDLYKKDIIEFIWETENWKACVEYAYKLLIDDNLYYDVEEQGRLLFEKSRNDFIMNRKKNWLFEKMKETSEDITKCKNIIDIIVTVLPEWKLEFILEFINKNSDSEAFKKINLFPSTRYGSGSEVPFIFDEIKFLKMLKDNLKGIDFIEHRAYLEERCRSLNKYREKLELMEYLENADYA